MTALSNLVSLLDCKEPEVINLFPKEYRERLLNNISQKELDITKDLVDNYVKEKLGNNIINYKIYSYKTLKDISVEILIQPENTSIVIQYVIELTKDSTNLVKVR